MTTLRPPICLGCTHFRSYQRPGTGYCAAYPSGIPLTIWQSSADHRRPQPGDHGITFEPKDPAAARYAAQLFARYANGKG